MTRLSLRALGALALFAFALPALAQTTPVGTWRTINDDTGEPQSLVRIYERDGELYGEIAGLLPEGRVCEDCDEEYRGSDMKGVEILRDFERDGDTWKGGRITDPQSGKTYKAKMEVERDGRLKVWGFVGFDSPLTRRTQYWERVQ
ncbi:DUF2147 domain-containing protein [Rubrivirga sp. S365]|uniref:DUF2147 domain-containing protein n=1 Tax=Rubrivirga litoralis TaxID=3075598 RepID=A0ABU3BNW0_9BACT|nr:MULTISPECIES: DUF2147 domain-containing protein [unclassified Rubrivirga]MDT0630973.1 DUF2147 domain-containing protein [Rubrivirga sp. F394]MDT7856616.1 DUF2147 domain-containing protein [Rubrivirga sp. S365]